jgi:hypothetical protein
MAKDPAMLWYWSDWNSGTVTFSRFMKGCYMDVLHAQFNNGHLSLEEIKNVLGSDFGQSWPTLSKKFSVDPAGKYFNARLEQEQLKRANFTESRRKNLKSNHTDTHINNHMHSHMENVNENRNGINEIKKGVENFGEKSKLYVSIKPVYVNQKWKMIYDLQVYFESTQQLTGVVDAGWTDFDGFHKANPSAVFDDDNHLYHSFKKHCTNRKAKPSTAGKIVTLEDLK